jgi:hypothetical protein
MTPATRLAGRIALAVATAGLCSLFTPVTAVFATQVGDESGVVTGTLDYTQPPPAPGSPCAPVAWTLTATGATAAASAFTTSGGGANGFLFAGTTTVTGRGTSSCATTGSDLFGSLALTITASGSSGPVQCSGNGTYTRVAAALVSELAMSCTLNGTALPPALVALAAALLPTTTDLAHFQVAGAYTFGLSDVTP